MRTARIALALLATSMLGLPIATAQYYPYVPDTRTTFDRGYLERDLDSSLTTPREKIEALRGLQRLDEQEMRERARALEYQQFQLGPAARLKRRLAPPLTKSRPSP